MNKEDLAYALQWSTPVPDYLVALARQTYLNTLAPHMMCSPYQGRVLSMLSKLQSPNCIFEIGTFTGYAALCLCEGLDTTGQLHTVEANPELAHIAEAAFVASPYNQQIHRHQGKAEDLWPQLDIRPELVFIDAGKKQYIRHYEMVLERMPSGGCIIVDNVLWHGHMASGMRTQDSDSIHAFNTHVQADTRVENLILPIRDGINIIRKK